MDNSLFLSKTEISAALSVRRMIKSSLDISKDDEHKITSFIMDAIASKKMERDVFDLNPVVRSLQTAILAIQETGIKEYGVIAILLDAVSSGNLEDTELFAQSFHPDVFKIMHGISRIRELYAKNPVIESENFRNLLITFADDMRVIFIMIADRVNLMRQIRDTENNEARIQVSQEAAYLYAPLAHKLGLYKLKSELEDLSLKYLETDTYYFIKEKLNATKRSRDAYIERFIQPIQKKLSEIGLNFHVKGRTKSIHSIWQKMKKQKCGFEGIYDLFAIRIILDSPIDKEKMQCWQAFSIVTDMYQPNPKRLRDWLSMPKSNGYESLHITVLGPEQKWVEVQIRTERMDEVAERGLAAHWRYKGVAAGRGLDDWLTDIRRCLENNDDLQVLDQFKKELYEDEIYIFSPKGDLYKLAKGATVLDFAYQIHSNVGNQCVGGRINGRAVSIRETLHSGDQVEILTQSNQKPNIDWLKIVKSARTKSKIRFALKETQIKEGLYAKEMLERRFKNRKIEFEEAVFNNVIKKLGFKETSDFYKQVAEDKIDINDVIERYLQQKESQQNASTSPLSTRSAEEYNYENPNEELIKLKDDVLVIGSNVKGIEYSLAKCCHPIFGDAVFGFVTVNGGIKIHRQNCPNATELRKRFGYRIVPATWSGKGNSQYGITLHVVGNDDIGVVNNITSVISKDEKNVLRSLNIASKDGLFSGNIVVQLDDVTRLESLIKRLKNIKGVKLVSRL